MASLCTLNERLEKEYWQSHSDNEANVMRYFQRFFAAACCLTILHASSASAHPGHGVDVDGSSVGHYLTSPVHIAGFLIAAVVVTCVALAVRSQRAKQPVAIQ